MQYLKAIYAAILAGIGATSSAYVSGNHHIGVVAGCTIATTVLLAAGGVWGVTNAPKEPPAS